MTVICARANPIKEILALNKVQISPTLPAGLFILLCVTFQKNITTVNTKTAILSLKYTKLD